MKKKMFGVLSCLLFGLSISSCNYTLENKVIDKQIEKVQEGRQFEFEHKVVDFFINLVTKEEN